MTLEQDREDLARHEREIEAHASFDYALFDDGETSLLGCVYLDPPRDAGEDVVCSRWVVDGLVGSPSERAWDAFVPSWLTGAWGFRAPRFGP